MSDYESDYEEIERIAEERRKDKELNDMAQNFQRLNQRVAAQQQQQDTMEVIKGFCEANGITQKEWQEAINDPEVAKPFPSSSTSRMT